MWKRCGSGKPQQSAAARGGTSLAERNERQTAADRSSCSRLTSRRSPVRAGHRPSPRFPSERNDRHRGMVNDTSRGVMLMEACGSAEVGTPGWESWCFMRRLDRGRPRCFPQILFHAGRTGPKWRLVRRALRGAWRMAILWFADEQLIIGTGMISRSDFVTELRRAIDRYRATVDDVEVDLACWTTNRATSLYRGVNTTKSCQPRDVSRRASTDHTFIDITLAVEPDVRLNYRRSRGSSP